MRIYPAIHYTMGGLWVDYHLMSNLPGLFVIGEANFSDHGANRLGASALMQGLADGYFVLPYTLSDFLARSGHDEGLSDSHPAVQAVVGEVRERIGTLLGIRGERSVDALHRDLGHVMWEECGMARNAAGLQGALGRVGEIREEFWRNLRVPGSGASLNQALEKAGRVADFLELAELMCE